jgi:hypothetical protein
MHLPEIVLAVQQQLPFSLDLFRQSCMNWVSTQQAPVRDVLLVQNQPATKGIVH